VQEKYGGCESLEGVESSGVQYPVIFTKRLREGVRNGSITCSVRIWMHPHVVVGGRYQMEEGEIEVESIHEITLADITPDLARRSGFKGVVDLLKIAKHGPGENVYLITFHYLRPGTRPSESPRPRRSRARRPPSPR
jgi:hypothetical protein